MQTKCEIRHVPFCWADSLLLMLLCFLPTLPMKQGSVMVFDTNYLKTITDNLGHTKSLSVSTRWQVTWCSAAVLLLLCAVQFQGWKSSVFSGFSVFFSSAVRIFLGFPYFFDFLFKKKIYISFFTSFCIVHRVTNWNYNLLNTAASAFYLHIFVKKSRFIINTSLVL